MDNIVRLRLNPFSETEKLYDFCEGENLQKVVYRVFDEINVEPSQINYFHVLVNGVEIESNLLNSVKLEFGDEVLISPAMKGGDFGQTFKQVAILAVTVAVGVASKGTLSPLAAGLATAGASIGTTLLLNSLIPPPQPPGLGSIGSTTSGGINSSQMYSISGQSNQAKPFGLVPKVYGTFKMYPNVVAQPYVDVEYDESTGRTVQYLYAIYDFGLGPMNVDNIKIGDTLISNFEEIDFNLVDPNKPDIDTGYWDAKLDGKTFELYKGEVETSSLSFEFTQNRVDTGTSSSNYQTVVTTADNIDNKISQIDLIFTYPQGLSSLKTDGTRGFVQIEFDVEFREVGTNTWLKWNNPTFVRSFSQTGLNSADTSLIAAEFAPNIFSPDNGLVINVAPSEKLLGSYGADYYGPIINEPPNIVAFYIEYQPSTIKEYGIEKGSTLFTIVQDSSIQVGFDVFYNGSRLGKIARLQNSRPDVQNGVQVIDVILDRPLSKSIRTKTIEKRVPTNNPNNPFYILRETFPISFKSSVTGKLFARGDASVDENATVQQFSSVRFTPRSVGQFEVRVTRIRTQSEFSYSVQDRAVLINLNTRFDQDPIRTDKRHVFLELKARATNQLNGTIDNLNAIVKGAVEVYDDSTQTWSWQLSSNPAWIVTDLMIGSVNEKAINKDRLDLDSLSEFADYADEIPTTPPSQANDFILPRFSSNFILDFETSVRDIIAQVLSACQASLKVNDGLYGILSDDKKTIPVQVFTPRNSSNFSATRNYVDQPDAIEVKFNDPTKNYQLSTQIVYDDGQDANSATNIQELESFGITNVEQAWRYGKYNMAQNQLRQEVITISVDFEYLVCTRGDYVQFTQDSMAAGGTPARVKEVSGSNIKIDDALSTSVSINYGYVFRSSTGSIVTDTLTVVDSDEFTLNGTLPAVGDLIIIGEVNKIVVDCIVKAIEPNDNLSATLTLVEKADGVFDALETGVTPDYAPQSLVGTNTENTAPPQVTNLQVTANSFFFDTDYRYYIDIGWEAPIGAAVDIYEVYVDNGSGFSLFDNTSELTYRYTLPSNEFLGDLHRFKVLGVSANGKKLNLGEVGFVSATPLRKTAPPSDIEVFSINITNQVITLDWDLVPDTDIRFYLIRYNPTLTGTWFTSTRLTEADRNTNTASVQARVGTYLIKAYDFAGNESANATVAITSIPELLELNIIETINDRLTSWPSTKQLVVPQGNALILQQTPDGDYFSEGFYFYENFLDLGDIYTVRLQNNIEAEGYREGDLMSTWTTLASIDPIASTTTTDWDVETQVRFRESLTVMSNWSPLSDVVRLNEGDVDEWSPWSKFVMGDFTGRLFQFRLRFISNIIDVTPRVTDGQIIADMPDRVHREDNITSGAGAYSVTYTPSFAGPGTTPNIQISIESGNSGDYYQITNKTLDGFDITFYDSTDTIVSRVFDYAAIGYGRKNSTVIKL